MKRKILISIHPEHVQNILNGRKKYEFRKIVAKQTINSILIYETSPTMKIVAEVDVKGVLTGAPNEIWQQTYNSSGITKEYFDAYFKGRKIAHAYKLGKIKIFESAKTLSDYGIKSAPQSFIYLEQ